MSSAERYDAAVIGASFAGLAAAGHLAGAGVLLVDREPIGGGQTSACGTLLAVLERLDARRATSTPGRTPPCLSARCRAGPAPAVPFAPFAQRHRATTPDS